MKETKVYVDDETLMKCERYRHNSCPIIQTHDRELVKEVCEKIRDVCKLNIRTYKKHLPEDCNKYKEVDAFNKAILGVLEFIDQLEKEFEK